MMEGLPAELLEETLLPLLLPDISRLSRTCKAFHSFLSPRVYHTIDWSWKDDGVCPPFGLLLRTLLCNFRLASHVKVLRLRGGGIVRESELENGYCHDRRYRIKDRNAWRPVQSSRSIWVQDGHMKTLYKKSEARTVGIMVSGFHHPEPGIWMDEFERGSVDVFVALLTGCIQKVERLDIGFGYIHRSVFFPSILRHLSMVQKSLAPYTDLMVVNLALDAPMCPEGFWSDMDLMRPFFFLPKVESINTVFQEPVMFTWPKPTMAPVLTSLSTLILRKTSAHEDTLGALLSCTPQLKHLVFEHHRITTGEPHWECAHYCPQQLYPSNARPCLECRGYYYEKWHIVRCQRLDKALSHVQYTLEKLVLRVKFEIRAGVERSRLTSDEINCERRMGVIGGISVLRRMPHLTNLEIPWVLLFGWEADMPISYQRYMEELPKLQMKDGAFDLSSFQWSAVIPSSIKQICLRDDLCHFSHYQYSERATIALVEKLLLVEREASFQALDSVSFYLMWRSRYPRTFWEKEVRMKAKVHEEMLRKLCTQCKIEHHILRERPG